MYKIILALLLTFGLLPLGFGQSMTQVIASSIEDAGGNKLASGSVCFLPTLPKNSSATAFAPGGGGIVYPRTVCAAVTNGAITPITLASSLFTSPVGVVYQITVTDTNTTESWILGSASVSGATWSLDAFIPGATFTFYPNAPSNVSGTLSVTGDITAPKFHGTADFALAADHWANLPNSCPAGMAPTSQDIHGNWLNCVTTSFQASGTTPGVIAQNPTGNQMITVPSGAFQRIGGASSYTQFDQNGAMTTPAISALTVNGVQYASLVGLTQAITNCGSAVCTIEVGSSIPVTANLTRPANVTFHFTNGGQFNIASGITVDFNQSYPDAPAGTQIFNGAGTVVGLIQIHPEWFGSAATIRSVANSASVNGAKILLGYNTYISGAATSQITQRNISILGSGEAQYASDNSSFLAGTGSIIKGGMGVDANGFTIKNTSIDVGTAQGTCSDGLGITPSNPATPLFDATIDHVSTLGCSATSIFHSILVENVTRAAVSNVQTRFNTYGLVLKCQNCSADHVVSAGHGSNCGIVKSDTEFGVSTGINLHDIKCSSITPGDTGEFNIDGSGAGVSQINLNGYSANQMKNGLLIDARADGANVGHMVDSTISNVVIDTVGTGIAISSDSSSSSFVQRLHLSNIIINNATGDAITINPGATNIDFSNVAMTNIGNNGFNNAAEGTIAVNVSCAGVTGFCVLGNQNHILAQNVFGSATAGLIGEQLGSVAYSTMNETKDAIEVKNLVVDGTLTVTQFPAITAPTTTVTANAPVTPAGTVTFGTQTAGISACGNIAGSVNCLAISIGGAIHWIPVF